MNKYVSITIGILLQSILLACDVKKKAAQVPPNIVFIIADDVSWEDLGAYGHSTIQTPNINRLATEGLLFTNMFLTASSCSPSRASILTGRYPHNTGAAELHTPLPDHLTYFPELLKEKGYYTALAGKWHEGENTKRAYSTMLINKDENGEGGEAQWLSLLENRPKNQPFFFWLAPYDAHREWSEKSALRKVYRPKDVVVPAHLVDDLNTRKDLASYYNEITRLDDHIGLLLEALEREGIADNTLIVFTADNPRAFPGNKTLLHDRGLKTPFIVRWPAGISTSGAKVEALVSSIDIAPTLLKAAKVDVVSTIQGISFDALFQNPTSAFRNYVFGEHNWHDFEAYERSVRTLDHLLIVNQRPHLANQGPLDALTSASMESLLEGLEEESLTSLQASIFTQPRVTEELYDVKVDSLQVNNLAADSTYASVLDHLRVTLTKWQQETGDTVPDSLTKDWYDRTTGEALPNKGIRGEMPGAAKNASRNNNKGPF